MIEKYGVALGALVLAIMVLRTVWLGVRAKRAIDVVNDDLTRQRARRRQ